MNTQFALQIVFNGLVLASSYALIASGLTLIFGVLRILNFAHGELIMAGAFVVWVLFAQFHVPFLIAILIAMLFVAGLALVIERTLFKRTRTNLFGGLVISLGLVYILQVVARLIFGPLDNVTPPAFLGQVQLFGVTFPIQRFVLIPITIGVMVIAWLFFERTRYGRAVRACIQDAEAASLHGISFDSMSVLVMVMGGALAGLAGGLMSLSIPIGPYLGTKLILKAFIVVIVGGMGDIWGTVAAAFIFGFLDSSVATLISLRFADPLDVGVLLLVLILRPRGLFGRE
jgi:branched-chain amino acid transport system permease protein